MKAPGEYPRGTVIVSAPVRGSMAPSDDLLIASLDQAGYGTETEPSRLLGVGAFDRITLARGWAVWGIPALAAAQGDRIFAYSRAGVVVALDRDGRERWRARVPDDRSPTAQARGQQRSPFVADVIPIGSSIYLAAGREILQIDSGDGRLIARADVCAGARGAVVRIARNGERGLIATCTERTDWDDEIAAPGPPLQRPRPLESWRTAPGDLVGFDLDLRESWRIPPIDGLVYDHRPPVVLEDGSIACLAGVVIGHGDNRYLSLGSSLVVFDQSSGEVRWRREAGSTHRLAEAVAVPGGVVDGGELALYERADGTRRWKVQPDQNGLDATVTPVLTSGRLLCAGRLGIRAIGLRNGLISDVGTFSSNPFNGSIVTPQVVARGSLYVGIEEAGEPFLVALHQVEP